MKITITIDLAHLHRDTIRDLLRLKDVKEALIDAITTNAADASTEEGSISRYHPATIFGEPVTPDPDPVTPDHAEHVADMFHAAMERGLSPWMARLAAEIEGEFEPLKWDPQDGLTKIAACRILQNLSTDWSRQDWTTAARYFGELPSKLRPYGSRRLGLSYCVRMVKAMFPQFDK